MASSMSLEELLAEKDQELERMVAERIMSHVYFAHPAYCSDRNAAAKALEQLSAEPVAVQLTFRDTLLALTDEGLVAYPVWELRLLTTPPRLLMIAALSTILEVYGN